MITLADCLAMSDLTAEEIAAIAEHEHVPEIVAAELGNYLSRRADGADAIRRMIADDIAEARRRGDFAHALRLGLVLREFCRAHPHAA